RIRAPLQEPAGQFRVVVEHRNVQGGQPARLIGGVDGVGVIADVLLDFRDLPPLLLGQSIAARGGAQQADEQESDGSLSDHFSGSGLTKALQRCHRPVRRLIRARWQAPFRLMFASQPPPYTTALRGPSPAALDGDTK